MERPHTNVNPFEYGRIEQEKPIVYVPDTALEWLGPQRQLFEGPRGCGKSSFLFAMRWEAAWTSPPMIQVRGGEEVRNRLVEHPRHIGLYFQFQEMDVRYWKWWRSRAADTEMAQRYFGTFVEYTIGHLFANAMHRIRSQSGGLFASRRAEVDIVQDSLEYAFPVASQRPRLMDRSFAELSGCLKSRCLELRSLVYECSPLEEVKARFPVLGPGSLAAAMAGQFRSSYSKQAEWLIMVLLDDCDALADWQAEVVNQAILKPSSFLTYKVSSVAGLYVRQAIDRRLTEHDLQTVPLPSGQLHRGVEPETNRSYLTVVEEVCKIRIQSHYTSQLAERFDLAQALGGFDVESALEERLRKSEKYDKASILLSGSSSHGGKPGVTARWLVTEGVRDAEIPLAAPADEKKAIRRLDSKYFKKWRYAAAVAIMQEFGMVFPYWGLPVVLHLGGGSVRDCLRVLSGIWEAARLPIDKFVAKSPIPHDIQCRGAKLAAHKFMSYLDERPMVEGGPSLRGLCMRLGNLFKALQSKPHMKVSPEAASVCVSVSAVSEDESGVIVEDAVRAGVLRSKHHGTDILMGLNPVLSPEFGISFRSPFYYPQRVSVEQLDALLTKGDAEWKRAEGEILAACAGRHISAQCSMPLQE